MSLSLQRRERTKRITPLLRHNGLNESFMQGVPGAESTMHRCFVCCVCFFASLMAEILLLYCVKIQLFVLYLGEILQTYHRLSWSELIRNICI